jgi:hypothetical protein
VSVSVVTFKAPLTAHVIKAFYRKLKSQPSATAFLCIIPPGFLLCRLKVLATTALQQALR